MIYFELQNQLESQSIVVNLVNIIVLFLIIIILLKTPKHVILKENNAKPTYLRYIKYDPETGNIKYTD
jgi:hypothetical protein